MLSCQASLREVTAIKYIFLDFIQAISTLINYDESNMFFFSSNP